MKQNTILVNLAVLERTITNPKNMEPKLKISFIDE